MVAWIGPAIAAGASLLGGFLGREHQEDQRAHNEALQREFAQSGIQWKVADAKKAGIHPLYALGSPSISPAVSVQGDPLAGALSSMGQDISRAARATESNSERGSTTLVQNLALERAGLQNELLRTQIASVKARMGQGGQVGPAIPVDEVTPFNVPQGKVEDRPPIMLDGTRVRTDPTTSPAKAYEDWLGDDIMSPGFIPNLYGALRQHYGPPATWPMQAMEALWASMKQDARNEYGNFNTFVHAIQRRRTRFGRPYEDTSGYSAY